MVNYLFSDSRWAIHPTTQKFLPRNMDSRRRVGRLPAFSRSWFMGINKDQVEGRAKEAAGKVQEVAGKSVGSTNQQVKGNINKNMGAAQAKFGDVKSHVKDAAKNAGKDSK
jgi:uncharacterized protein YjbJ (UPF0337 family)